MYWGHQKGTVIPEGALQLAGGDHQGMTSGRKVDGSENEPLEGAQDFGGAHPNPLHMRTSAR